MAMKGNLQQIRKHATGLIGLLVAQYILGMLTNLYVHFPERASVAKNWEFMRGQWLVWAHLITGTLIVFGAIALYIKAVELRNKTWKVAGGITTGSAIVAWVCGEEFVSSQSDLYSFAMSVFFIVALVALGVGLYKAKQ